MPTLISTNPAKNYQKLGQVTTSSASSIKQKVTAANDAKLIWSNFGVTKRTQLLKPLVKLSIQHQKDLINLTVKEIGKPIKEAKADFNWDIGYLKAFLKDGPTYLKDHIIHKDKASTHTIIYEPIGTAAVIVPWNFPFANFLWGVVPNLIAGNPVVFKHSEECPLIGKLIDKIMNKLKLPQGVFSQIYGGGKVGETLVNQDINLIWFTGSSIVGKKLYQIAGQKFIKAILELGGSNPAVVFDDVNIKKIAPQLFEGRYMNCGQVCDAVKRLIVHHSIADELVEQLTKLAESSIVGDPENKKTDIGSLVAKRQLKLLKDQVADAVQKGAKIATGGKSPQGLKGAYYLPTILTSVKPNMRVWTEEVFGPVLAVRTFKTEQEAIRLANDTNYGLGAQVHARDKQQALRVAAAIQAGCIDVNQGNHWLPCTPFGGYKESGMGREHGENGFRELTQIKVIAT